MTGEIKGHCIVDGCGAVVEIKTNKAGKFYFACNGNSDPRFKACGTVVTFGKAATQRMKAKMEKELPGETDNRSQEPGTGNPGTDRPGSAEPGPGKPGNEKPAGGAFW